MEDGTFGLSLISELFEGCDDSHKVSLLFCKCIKKSDFNDN